MRNPFFILAAEIKARLGARALEATVPGSVGRLNVATLDQEDCEQCAFGQTFGLFQLAPINLYRLRIRYGCAGVDEIYGVPMSYLTAAWKRAAVRYGAVPA